MSYTILLLYYYSIKTMSHIIILLYCYDNVAGMWQDS